MQELISLSTRVVVMAERGQRMLQDTYDAPRAKIDLIAHGIPDVGFIDPTYFKDQFGVDGRVVLLTFGLLSPNKGIEYVLNALPNILTEFPEVVYIVLGATHPNELREHGEAYRLGLEILTKKNKIEKNVIFYNQFVDLENLKEFIGAADLYITPYLNEAQITSGTLVLTCINISYIVNSWARRKPDAQETTDTKMYGGRQKGFGKMGSKSNHGSSPGRTSPNHFEMSGGRGGWRNCAPP
jgi:hypothetical protein